MKKKLTEMTLEELWQLFPIFLVPHKNEWKNNFIQEKAYLVKMLKNSEIIRIEHVGSTVVPHIYAKDIVDILIQVEEKYFDRAIALLKENGYVLMYQKDTRSTFNKGYTEDGFAEKVYHIHLRKKEDIDELYFRDYLIEFPHIAQAYETLKLGLCEQYEHNRDGYTEAKSSFINKVTEEAKALYKNRY